MAINKNTGSGRKSGKAVVVNNETVSATVISLAIERLKPAAHIAADQYFESDRKTENMGQALAYHAMLHLETLVANRDNQLVPWDRMQDTHRQLTDGGKKWIARVVKDFVPANPRIGNAPSDDLSKQIAELEKKRQAWRNACKLAIVIGASGGKSAAFDTKRRVFFVNRNVFIPVVRGKRTWTMIGNKPDTIPLLGGGFVLTRDGVRSDKAAEIKSLTFSVRQAVTSWFAKPEGTTPTGVPVPTADKKGADDKSAGLFEPATIRAVLSKTDFGDKLVSAMADMKSDKTAVINRDTFKGRDDVFNALAYLAGVYTRIMTETVNDKPATASIAKSA